MSRPFGSAGGSRPASTSSTERVVKAFVLGKTPAASKIAAFSTAVCSVFALSTPLASSALNLLPTPAAPGTAELARDKTPPIKAFLLATLAALSSGVSLASLALRAAKISFKPRLF